MPETKLINIKINDIPVQVPAGEKIIESARRAGVDIPFFCYHPRLSMNEGGANCRMCLVEVAMPRRNPDGSTVVARMPKPQTACSLPASEGMEIFTETEQISAARKGMLEFLLINHPLDCPICDRGGECPLQNNTLHYGADTSRFIEEKRHFPKAYPLSEHVVFDRERCIHCARCTRFTRDISGDSQLDFLFRGADMRVSTFNNSTMNSRFSGNVIELCPVGALLSRAYRFKARPWDLLTQKSICTQCANGCNIKLDYRVGKLQRVNARVNEAVNEEWTCDKGKFGMDYVSDDSRIRQPLVRKKGKFVAVSWREANAAIVEKLKEAGSSVAGIGGAHTPNEDLYVWQRLFRETFKTNNLDHRMGPGFGPTNNTLFKRLGYHTTGNSIEELENKKSILILGSNLVDEQPIVFLRVRKAWKKYGASIVHAIPDNWNAETDTDYVSEFAALTVRYKAGKELELLTALSTLDPAAVADAGLETSDVEEALRIMSGSPAAIITGSAFDATLAAESGQNALCNLADKLDCIDSVNIPATTCNQQGAMDMGILPDSLPGYAPSDIVGLNTGQILKSVENGEIKLLWIVGSDVANEYHDKDAAVRALENAPFLVVNALNLNDTAKMADVVLPVQSVAERDGSYTNMERRIQPFHKAFELSPEIRSDWMVFAEISALMSAPLSYVSISDIRREIAINVPIYASIATDGLTDEGIRWEYASSISLK